MKGLKFLAACAAVGAVSVACAVSSLADDSTYVLGVSDYDAVNGTIDVTVTDEYKALVDGDYTLLVLSDDVTVTNENSSIVKQIQQGELTILTGVKVGTDLEKGKTYYVRVGGADEGFAAGTFTVPSSSDNPYADSERKVGDVNGDTFVNASDVAPFLRYQAGSSVLTGEDLQAADVTDDGFANAGDVSPFLRYQAGSLADFTVTMVKDKQNIVE